MAILVGVLAPNLLRYIEKAKIASDIQLTDTIGTAILIARLDPEIPTYNMDFPGSAHVLASTSEWHINGGGAFHYGRLGDSDFPPFTEAIAQTLGYPDALTMCDPTNGLLSQFRSLPEKSEDGYEIIYDVVVLFDKHPATHVTTPGKTWVIVLDAYGDSYFCWPECTGWWHSENPPPGHIYIP